MLNVTVPKEMFTVQLCFWIQMFCFFLYNFGIGIQNFYVNSTAFFKVKSELYYVDISIRAQSSIMYTHVWDRLRVGNRFHEC